MKAYSRCTKKARMYNDDFQNGIVETITYNYGVILLYTH
jgi:hypothetical protein